jgi:hypothetical protein
MGFFSRLFGWNKEELFPEDNSTPIDNSIYEYKEPELGGTPFYTNAPKHWGTITDDFLDSNKNFSQTFDDKTSDVILEKRMFMVNSLVLLGKINDALQKINKDKVHTSYRDALLEEEYQYATSCCIEKLFSKGIISINGVVIDNYKRYAVLLFLKPTPLSYVEALKPYFEEEGYEDLIYFAQQDPTTVTEEKSLKFEGFTKNCFGFNKEKQGLPFRKYTEYAMWWQGIDTDFDSSSMKKDIKTYLDLLDFHNSYALGVLSFAFNLKEDNSRTLMPSYDEVIMEGPEGVEIILSLSEERGINFHFPMLERYEKYRNNFIKTYIEFCYDIRAQIVENDFPKDDFGHPSSLEWYTNLLKNAQEKGEKIRVLGALNTGHILN